MAHGGAVLPAFPAPLADGLSGPSRVQILEPIRAPGVTVTALLAGAPAGPGRAGPGLHDAAVDRMTPKKIDVPGGEAARDTYCSVADDATPVKLEPPRSLPPFAPQVSLADVLSRAWPQMGPTSLSHSVPGSQVPSAPPGATLPSVCQELTKTEAPGRVGGFARDIGAPGTLHGNSRGPASYAAPPAEPRGFAPPPGLHPPLPQPTEGSALHGSGECRPCPWFWKRGGCKNGRGCLHCHLCPEGESKARKKSKKSSMRSDAIPPQNMAYATRREGMVRDVSFGSDVETTTGSPSPSISERGSFHA